MSLRMTELTKIPIGDSTMQDAAAVEHYPKIPQKWMVKWDLLKRLKGIFQNIL